MDDRVKKWLEDILIAIDEIDVFFEIIPNEMRNLLQFIR